MKKIFILFMMTITFCAYAQNVMVLNGVSYPVDTLVHKHDVGPGTRYAYYNLPTMPLRVHVMEIDLKNPYVDIETCLSGDKVVATEPPTLMAERNNKPGHEVIGATNGDFYHYQYPIEIGTPRSGQFRKNECVVNPVGRASFVLTPDRKPYVDRVDFSGTVKAGEKTHRLHAVNMQRLEWETSSIPNYMLLYTNSYGPATHEAQGGVKVVLKPKAGEFFFSANKNIECIVDSIYDNPGTTPIPEGRAVLYGVGTAETFLKDLNIGDETTLFLGTNLRDAPGLITDLKEQMGGSDHIILRNGELADGDYVDVHPRTGMGFSADSTKVYMVVVDGRRAGYSSGVSLNVFGELFRALGAWNAVNLDGGGSSVMIVNSEVVNNPSDNLIRPVGNGVLVVSNAPIDDEIASLQFEPQRYILPVYGRLVPRIIAFNKYGVIKEHDFKGYTLTCSPNVGYIDDSNAFVAASTPCKGTITATWNDISVTREVEIRDAEFSMRLDSVVLDGYRSFPIEIQGEMDGRVLLLSPASLTWTVENPDICSVDEGVVKGLKDGETLVTGTLDDFVGTLKVKVQIPKTQVMKADDFISSWNVSSISAIKNLSVSRDGDEAVIKYTYGAGRAPYVQISKKIDFYSIPDTFKITVNTGEVVTTKVSMMMKSNQDRNYQLTEWPSVPKGEDYTYSVPMDTYLTDAADFANYPVKFEQLKFMIDVASQTAGREYEIRIKEFDLVYKHFTMGVGNPEIIKSLLVYPNPLRNGDSSIFLRISESVDLSVELYNLQGQLIRTKDFGHVQPGDVALPADGLDMGSYLLKIWQNGRFETVKLMVR